MRASNNTDDAIIIGSRCFRDSARSQLRKPTHPAASGQLDHLDMSSVASEARCGRSPIIWAAHSVGHFARSEGRFWQARRWDKVRQSLELDLGGVVDLIPRHLDRLAVGVEQHESVASGTYAMLAGDLI